MRNAMWVGGGITGMGEIPVLGVKEKGIAKVIRDIFRNGEQGFFYDPSDLKTQYQDAAGTTSVKSVGQPVGLMLDKSKGEVLGDEKSEYADGFTSLTRISAAGVTTALEGRALVATAQSGGARRAEIPISGLTVGKFYVIKFIARKNEIGGTQSLQLFTAFTKSSYGTSVTSTTTTEYTFILEATAVSGVLRAYAANTDAPGAQIIVESVSVRELAGNHAYQTTSAARPIFLQKPILGDELFPTLDFTVAWKGLPATTSVTAKSFTTPGVGGVSIPLPLDPNKQYQVTLNYTISNPAVTVQILSGTIGSGTVVSAGTSLTRSAIMSGGNPSGILGVYIRAQDAATVTVNSISLKEVTGYLTDQNYIEYDGVDDKLNTDLPAPLTNATVLRAVPGVGTQVKYNQSLPMFYEDSTNHSGLIAIDRVLTRSEQLRLMTELDKKAGATSFDTTTFKMFDPMQQGFYFDPNDLSTMFQNDAGSVPVTDVGQPVGLMLDKSKQLKEGSNLVINPTFNTLNGWGNYGNPTITPIAPGEVKVEGDGKAGGLSQVIITDGNWVCVKAKIKIERDTSVPSSGLNFIAYTTTSYANGRSINLPQIGEYVECAIYIRSSLATGEIRIYFQNNSSSSVMYVKDVSVHAVAGNHAFQTTSSYRPILRKDAVTGANYLEFDGVDDFLQTSNIDFTGTDKVSLFAGVKTVSNSATSSIVESGSSYINPLGGFAIRNPITSGSLYGGMYASASISGTQSIRAIVSDIPSAIAGTIDFSKGTLAEQIALRVNGVKSLEAVTGTPGQGKFSNIPVYIGSRAGTMQRLAGNIYSLICIGKILSESDVTSIEKELAKRVGATLNV